MKGFNLKEVCKQIKYDGKRSLIWSRENGHHYVTNNHWMMRFVDGQMPREILVTLFSIFAEIPKEGRALIMHTGIQNEIKAVNVQGVYSLFANSGDGEITPFIKDLGSVKMRAIRYNEEVVYINEAYSMMVYMESHKPQCSGKLTPVFFMDGAFVILPYRAPGGNDTSILDELIAAV